MESHRITQNQWNLGIIESAFSPLDFDDSDLLMSLNSLSEMKQYKAIDMPLRNVTKIQFGTWFDRDNG